MTRIFTDGKDIVSDGKIVITGDNANHISRSLRMRQGEKLIVCDGVNTEYHCTIEAFTSDTVTANVDSVDFGVNEPCYSATLFMALPKSDKMELIVQKAVETGVSRIVPFISSRCISKPDEKSAKGKVERWGKIAKSAAEQCGRVRIPEIAPVVSFDAALREMASLEEKFVCYECEREHSLGKYLSFLKEKNSRNIGFMIGAEGGFSPEEVEKCSSLGIEVISLGRRILRCETAPLFVLSVMSAILDE